MYVTSSTAALNPYLWQRANYIQSCSVQDIALTDLVAHSHLPLGFMPCGQVYTIPDTWANAQIAYLPNDLNTISRTNNNPHTNMSYTPNDLLRNSPLSRNTIQNNILTMTFEPNDLSHNNTISRNGTLSRNTTQNTPTTHSVTFIPNDLSRNSTLSGNDKILRNTSQNTPTSVTNTITSNDLANSATLRNETILRNTTQNSPTNTTMSYASDLSRNCLMRNVAQNGENTRQNDLLRDNFCGGMLMMRKNDDNRGFNSEMTKKNDDRGFDSEMSRGNMFWVPAEQDKVENVSDWEQNHNYHNQGRWVTFNQL